MTFPSPHKQRGDEQIRSQHDGNERRYSQEQAPQGSRLCPTPAIAEAGCENQVPVERMCMRMP